MSEEPKVDDPNEIAKMNQRQVKLGMLAQEVALAGLLELKQKMATSTPLNLSGDEARRLLDVGLRLERAARGLPEDITEEEKNRGSASRNCVCAIAVLFEPTFES
jgi:hypothetical protein